MRMVHIKFKNKSDDARGAHELARRVRVACLPGDTYEIAEQSLKILDDLGIPYTILETEGFDRAYGKIRDSAASKILMTAPTSNMRIFSRPEGS